MLEPRPSPAPTRQAFYDRISASSLTPLWEVLKSLVVKEPRSAAVAHCWRWEAVRPFVLEAGAVISAEEAERRVLILENPGLRGQSRITNTLYAGLQLILPGEVARAHRHTQCALRFVVEGSGAYTAVDGERTLMRPGDFVITPSWAWHDHGNESDAPMVWLDGLDIPIVGFFDASFAEAFEADMQPQARPAGDAQARFGEGLLPLGHARVAAASPVFNYPYARSRDALEKLRRTGPIDACHGLAMRYANPLDGGWAMPTIGTWLHYFPKDFSGAPYRATDATVFSCIEGTGRVYVFAPGGKLESFEFGPRDIFVVPSWQWRRFEATSDCVLFAFSDRPAQEKLGLWREMRGNV